MAGVIARCAEVLGAPTTVVSEVNLQRDSVSVKVVIRGQGCSYQGPVSALHSLAAHLWQVDDALLWGFQKHPTHGYLVNAIEFALFTGDLEDAMRELATALSAVGALQEAQLCLLRVIFPEDARTDPLGKRIFADNPAQGIPASAASPAGFLRQVLPLMAAKEPVRRLAAIRQVAMMLDDVQEETSGKRLDDILQECRAAVSLCLQDETLAVRDLARVVEARLNLL